MRIRNVVVGMIAVTMLFTSGIGFAEEVNHGEKPGTVSDEAQAVQDMALADELADYGRRTENPLALVVAAQIMKNTPVQDQERAKETEGEPSATKTKEGGKMDTPESLLAEAKAMTNDELVVGLIDKESKMVAQRGRVGGGARHVDRVYPGRTDVYQNVRFRGGQLARVAIIGDGDCDLDLRVYDEHGNLVDSDLDGTDKCLAEWTPRWTGPFTIKVKNYSCGVYADYALLTN